jgi:hypothetical protein
VLNRAGPGLLERLFVPWNSFAAQGPLFVEHAGGLQALLLAAGLLIATLCAVRSRQRGATILVLLAWSGVYLLIASQGTHPTKGYWCYPGALLFLCVGYIVSQAFDRIGRSVRWPGVAGGLVGAVLAASLVPGSGVRTTMSHLRHWSDINYDSRRFVQTLLDETPTEARTLVDPAYVFDFYLAGRRPVLALTYEFFFDVRGVPYDYLVAGPYSIRDGVPQQVDGEYLRSFGDREDLFACYAELYRAPRHQATAAREATR